MMGNKEELFQILDTFKGVISSTWESDKVEDFCSCLLFSNDLKEWTVVLEKIPQSIILRSAHNECVTANLFCSLGLYKQAMISLRLCLEHCLHAIQLSANDFQFRRWKAGQVDMQWASIVSPDDGLFSKAFIKAYAPEFVERSAELHSIAKNVYRECSEYVHGNYDKLNSLPAQSQFNQELFDRYIQAFHSVSYLLSITLVIRFKDHLLSNGVLRSLEQPIMNTISMLPEIQHLFEVEEC